MMGRVQLWLLAAIIGIAGLWLVAGGAWLLTLDGSPYYLPAGVVFLAAAVLIALRRRAGGFVYLAALAATLVWSLTEVGLAFWLLLPRLAGPVVLGFWLVAPWIWRQLNPSGRCAWLPMCLYAGSVVILLGAVALPRDGIPGTVAPAMAVAAPAPASGDATQWPTFGNSPASTRYSPANQITPANVRKLKPVWEYHTGDLPGDYPGGRSNQMSEATPIKIGDTLYACTPRNIVVALDAETGREKWRHDPKIDSTYVPMAICRGVSFYQAPAGTADCPQRILVATIDARMIALDAQSGRMCRSFGSNGAISLKEGLGEVPPGFYYVTSPPAIVGKLAVVGSLVLDNMAVDEPSGVVRAFDAITGRLVWSWDAAAPEGGGQFVRGSPNSWSLFSVDPKLNLVYIPTGGATPDHFGGTRGPAKDRHATSVVALDGSTGRLRWSFQTVHHDLWDYDVAAQPVLIDLTIDGQQTPTLVQPTKQGEIFLLDRRTGKPLTPVNEAPVPRGDVPGEYYAPTQPLSPAFPAVGPRALAESDMWGATPLDQLWCRIRYRSMNYKGRFTPPAFQQTLQFPGNNGIYNWGSAAIDERRKIMIVNSSYMPIVLTMIPRSQAPKTEGIVVEGASAVSPMTGTPYAVSAEKPFLSPLGIPCNAPPWGEIAAIDLNTRELLWKRPLGTTADHAPLGIAVPGTFNQGGSVITEGGVVFIAAALDNYLRAFDAQSGRELWKGRLPAGGQASPMTYVSKSGKQMVVISAGGHQFMQTTIGDSIIAFALE